MRQRIRDVFYRTKRWFECSIIRSVLWRKFRKLIDWFKGIFMIKWIAIGIFDKKVWQHDPALYDQAIAARKWNEQNNGSMTPKQLARVLVEFHREFRG